MCEKGADRGGVSAGAADGRVRVLLNALALEIKVSKIDLLHHGYWWSISLSCSRAWVYSFAHKGTQRLDDTKGSIPVARKTAL